MQVAVTTRAPIFECTFMYGNYYKHFFEMVKRISNLVVMTVSKYGISFKSCANDCYITTVFPMQNFSHYAFNSPDAFHNYFMIKDLIPITSKISKRNCSLTFSQLDAFYDSSANLGEITLDVKLKTGEHETITTQIKLLRHPVLKFKVIEGVGDMLWKPFITVNSLSFSNAFFKAIKSVRTIKTLSINIIFDNENDDMLLNSIHASGNNTITYSFKQDANIQNYIHDDNDHRYTIFSVPNEFAQSVTKISNLCIEDFVKVYVPSKDCFYINFNVSGGHGFSKIHLFNNSYGGDSGGV